jgi:hypothetical protein
MPKKDGTPTAQEKRELVARDRKLVQLENYSYWQGCACSPEVLRERIEYLHRKLHSVHPDLWETDPVCLQRWAQLNGLRDAAVDRGMAKWAGAR